MEAAQMMANRDVEQLPVVRDGVLVGFLNRDAVLRALSGGGESEQDDPGSREGEP
jgi:CBS domain-containing protein